MTQDVPTRQTQSLNPRLLLGLLTPQTWAIVILGTLVAVTIVPQWLKGGRTEAAPTVTRLTTEEKRQAWDALVDGEARRLNAEAQRQISIPNSECRNRDKTCVLDRFQREATDRLAQTFATSPGIAAEAYFRLEAIEKARSLGGVSDAEPLKRYLQAQQ